ncbi:MAG: HAMP domain-containing protein [Actinobacteria bacterium]|nr:HAMP domain-containing protein [Actinomycetota bacterium]
MAEEKRVSGTKRAGSKILIQIISLIIIICIASGIMSFLIFRSAQNRVIQNSKDKLVEYNGNLKCSSSRYVTNIMTQIFLLETPGASAGNITNELALGYNQQTVTPVQQSIDQMLSQLVEDGFYDSSMILYALPPESGAGYRSVIVMSSDGNFIYTELPDELRELATMKESQDEARHERIDDRNSYKLFSEGIPELGLEGEFLVTSYIYTPDPAGMDLWFFNCSSVHDELAAIDSFYAAERSNIDRMLILLLALSTLGLVVIIAMVMSYLIRKNITRPIDELEKAAEKVMDGDLDVEVPVKAGEEFEGLKVAFNNMLVSLQHFMNRSLGVDDNTDNGSGASGRPVDDKPGKGRKRRGGRSSMFFKVAILIIVVFLISGGIGMVLFYQSQARLAEASRQKIVRSVVDVIESGYLAVSKLVERYYFKILPGFADPGEIQEMMAMFMNSIRTGTSNPVLEAINDAMSEYPEQGFHDLVLVFEAMPERPGVVDVPTIVMSSESDIMFTELPKVFVELHEMTEEENTDYRARIDEDSVYMLLEDGLPDFGLPGEHLVIVYDHVVQMAGAESTYWFFTIKPMDRELAEIDSFYDRENRNTFILMGGMIVAGIIAVAVIILVVFSYLLKTRITAPVDELSEAAGQVMEGNLDIEVPVKSGEEFERLKRTFNEMLKSLSEIMEKGTRD